MDRKDVLAGLLKKGLPYILVAVISCCVTLGTLAIAGNEQPADNNSSLLDAEKEALEESKKELEELLAQNQALLDQMASHKTEIQQILDETLKQKAEIESKIEELKAVYDELDDWQSKQWLMPIKYTYVASEFGYRVHPVYGEGKFHYGVDLAAPKNTPIVASRSGRVYVTAYEEEGAGYYVNIDHDDGFVTRYLHMTKYIVTEGQYVIAGQVIGYCGDTGTATGYHLHFGVYYNGVAVDPAKYIDI